MRLLPGKLAIAFTALMISFSPLSAQPPTNSIASAGPAENTAIVPVPRDPQWVQRHKDFLKVARTQKIDLLFLGDSITDFWRTRGSNVWNQFYASRHAANFGISGDRTQHVLWRIQNGELDGLSPRVVVLLIGTNNTGKEKNGAMRNTPEEAIAGVTGVVKAIRGKLPDSKILLLAIFPRGGPNDLSRQQIRQINPAISGLADNRTIVFLDLSDKFLSPDDTISKGIMPDLLHPSEKGYQIWATAMEPTLEALLAPQTPLIHGRIQ